MIICGDFHFHLNSKGGNGALKRAHKALMNAAHLDFLCSTEHAYKNPVEAYYYLAEASANTKTSVIPGVEAISKEGIDLIAIFRSVDELKKSIFNTPFSWSIFDLDNVSGDAIIIMPHMFTPSKTGVVTTLGQDAAMRIVERCDYVEVNNGAFYDLVHSGVSHVFPKKYRRKIEMTASMPPLQIPKTGGYSIGSDAHEPWGMNIYGIADVDSEFFQESIFDILNRRLKFTTAASSQYRSGAIGGSARAFSSGITSVSEFIIKSKKRKNNAKA